MSKIDEKLEKYLSEKERETETNYVIDFLVKGNHLQQDPTVKEIHATKGAKGAGAYESIEDAKKAAIKTLEETIKKVKRIKD